jgi:hypothetical protein
MLIYTLPVVGQQYNILIKKKSILKNDEFGDCNAKIVISDNKLILFSQQNTPKKSLNQLYELNYPAYDLKTGQKTRIKVRINEPLFEYIDVQNLQTQICDNLVLLKVNEFAMQNLNYAKTKLLILKKSDKNTFTEVDYIDNFQRYDGYSYQISPSKLLFYKNNDYHPLDDSIPTLTSIYNIESGTFEKKQVEHFKGIYVTNLVGQLVAAKRNTIFRAYPTENMVTVSDESLNVIDTILIPISKNYTHLYHKIDSIKQVYPSKKEFIQVSKKIDAHIERIESIYLLSNNDLGIIIKPENGENFSTRKLLVYDLTSKNFTNTIQLHYDYSGKKKTITEPNFTYTNNAVLFSESIDAIVYTVTDKFIKNGKLKGSENYFIHVMKYNHRTVISKQQIEKTDHDFSSLADTDITLFSLKGDTISLSQLLESKSAILVKNKRNCSPCFKKAYQLLNKEYEHYNKYYICEFSGEQLSLFVDEKNIRKALKVKNIYYFKPSDKQAKGLPNLTNTPTPFILSADNKKIDYLPLDLIIGE